MNQLRAPRIAGVAGGVGTTTLATALRGYDRGRGFDRGVEVLVCRTTGDSLHAAATAIAWLGANARPRPVLAVNADGMMPVRGPLRARLRMIEPQVSGLVVLPYVAHWRELTDPLGEASRLSEAPSEQLPKALRSYGEALGELAEAVLRSGLLLGTRSTPPRHDPRASVDPFGRPHSVEHTGANRTVPTPAVALSAIPVVPGGSP